MGENVTIETSMTVIHGSPVANTGNGARLIRLRTRSSGRAGRRGSIGKLVPVVLRHRPRRLLAFGESGNRRGLEHRQDFNKINVARISGQAPFRAVTV